MTDFIGVLTVFLLMGGAREFRVLDLHGGGALVLVLGLKSAACSSPIVGVELSSRRWNQSSTSTDMILAMETCYLMLTVTKKSRPMSSISYS